MLRMGVFICRTFDFQRFFTAPFNDQSVFKRDNFPQYTPYAGSDVKYHFMFQFLCGNLEYLGLRLDWAFNLPSVIGLLMTISAFYVFSVKFFQEKGGRDTVYSSVPFQIIA